jgi:hypothetical protein
MIGSESLEWVVSDPACFRCDDPVAENNPAARYFLTVVDPRTYRQRRLDDEEWADLRDRHPRAGLPAIARSALRLGLLCPACVAAAIAAG